MSGAPLCLHSLILGLPTRKIIELKSCWNLVCWPVGTCLWSTFNSWKVDWFLRMMPQSAQNDAKMCFYYFRPNIFYFRRGRPTLKMFKIMRPLATLSDGQCVVCFFCRAMLCISAAYAVMRCLSVCPSVRLSVRLSRLWIMSKWINISSKLFHHRVATPF